MGAEGQKFIQECWAAGKEVCVWTVNDPNEIKVAMQWGLRAILTDHVGAYKEIREEVRVLRTLGVGCVVWGQTDARSSMTPLSCNYKVSRHILSLGQIGSIIAQHTYVLKPSFL